MKLPAMAARRHQSACLADLLSRRTRMGSNGPAVTVSAADDRHRAAPGRCFLDLPSLFAEFATNLRKGRQLEGIVRVRESENLINSLAKQRSDRQDEREACFTARAIATHANGATTLPERAGGALRVTSAASQSGAPRQQRPVVGAVLMSVLPLAPPPSRSASGR
jgi:hypothetical protein